MAPPADPHRIRPIVVVLVAALLLGLAVLATVERAAERPTPPATPTQT